MKRLRIVCAILLLVVLAGPARSEAAWVWSPQTGWVGPSGAVKDTPEEQLAYGVSLFEQQDYKRARKEFKKLLKHYKDSREAAEAQYHIGRCLEEEADYYAAFLAYRETVEVYPSTERFEEILERMYRIGNYFLEGHKRKVFGTVAILPAREKAVEIFRAMVEDGPFSPHGELAQYKLGLAHLALGEYEQAVSAFEQLIDRYSSSPLVDDARFQLAQASLKGTFRPGYDQYPTEQAIEELEVFVSGYASSDLAPEALERLQTLREQRAAHEYGVAQFYERRREWEAARVYYEAVVNQYGDTSLAPQAASRLHIVRQRLQ